MKTQRTVIEIDENRCNGCGECVPSCAEGAIQIIDGKAKLISDKYCDGLGACLGKCPQDAIRLVTREVEAFEGPAPNAPKHTPQPVCPGAATAMQPGGCPGARIQNLQTDAPVAAPSTTPVPHPPSALTHWPIQIRIVPPAAPFLRGAHVLIAADCVPVACPGFHTNLLQGRVVLMGCPKFDDVDLYVQRLTDVFIQANISSITVAVMEVPCCRGMLRIVEEALARSEKNIPAERVIISLRGEVLDKKPLAG